MITWFPLGLAYISAVLRKHGHEVTIYQQDQYHYPEEHLTEYLNTHYFDVIGLGIIAGYWQYKRMLSISRAINASKQRPFYIMGGHGPSPEPEYFLRKSGADFVVIGEGENTIIDLLDQIEIGRNYEQVDGIAFIDSNDKCIITKPREQIKDIDTLPFPAWDLFPMDYYALIREPNIINSERCFPMVSGKGCMHKCAFCYRLDKGIRIRDNESIIEEMTILNKKYGINYIAFDDELLMVSEARTIGLSEAIIKSGLKIKWNCQGRLNYAKPEVLKAMKAAGCVWIGYGIESYDDDVLEKMNKRLTVAEIESGIKATLAEGISPGFNIIFGSVGDTKETLDKGINFLLKYDDHSQLRTIRPVTPYPGSPLYYLAIEKGLLKDCADFYENKHLNSDLMAVNFTELSDEKFYDCLFRANKTLLENYTKHKLESNIRAFEKLYFERDVSFRGLRGT